MEVELLTWWGLSKIPIPIPRCESSVNSRYLCENFAVITYILNKVKKIVKIKDSLFFPFSFYFFPTWNRAFIFKNNQEVRGDESFMGKDGFKVQTTGLQLYFNTLCGNYKIFQVYI